jgi:hypothetical protein
VRKGTSGRTTLNADGSGCTQIAAARTNYLGV